MRNELCVLEGGLSDDTGLAPVLGEIARLWPQIHPGDLTPSEALRLLSVLSDVTDRLGGQHE